MINLINPALKIIILFDFRRVDDRFLRVRARQFSEEAVAKYRVRISRNSIRNSLEFMVGFSRSRLQRSLPITIVCSRLTGERRVKNNLAIKRAWRRRVACFVRLSPLKRKVKLPKWATTTCANTSRHLKLKLIFLIFRPYFSNSRFTVRDDAKNDRNPRDGVGFVLCRFQFRKRVRTSERVVWVFDIKKSNTLLDFRRGNEELRIYFPSRSEDCCRKTRIIPNTQVNEQCSLVKVMLKKVFSQKAES